MILLAYLIMLVIDSHVIALNDNKVSCSRENYVSFEKPNFIILLADDLGYGDLSCYGHPTQEYGGIDQMASEGLKFMSFYSADSLCSPSRAGLLTGRLPIRSGITGGERVFVPKDTGGLPKNETTLAEALKSLGYVTGMVGKWHLGINSFNHSDGAHLPSKHGFDFVGYNLPFSNVWDCDETGIFMKEGPDPKRCFLYRHDTIIQQPINHETLTQNLLDDFKLFVEQNIKYPFFFYFSFPHVHADLFASYKFKNGSKRGFFGGNLNEMHWAVDEIVNFLKLKQIDQKTLVIFLSDHGPHRELCQLGGVTGGLKGGKAMSFEGGFRIPTIVRWPSVVPQGKVSHVPLTALDLFPTLFCLAGGESLPDDRIYDGMDVSDYLLGRKFETKLDPLNNRLTYFFCNQTLMAVRYRNLKFHFATPVLETEEESKLICPYGLPWKVFYREDTCVDEKINHHDPPLIYDLDRDPFEIYGLNVSSVAEEWAEVQQKLSKFTASLVMVDQQLGHFDKNVVPCCNFPKCTCNYP